MPTIKNYRLSIILASFHIFIIAASNYLVQFPISVFGFKATWGAFTFPFIFLATDLTVRLLGAKIGRKVIFKAMFPALVVSYLVTNGFRSGVWLGIDHMFSFDLFVARIAIASFAAYVIGQFIDVFVFNRLRKSKTWWYAPLASTLMGNLIDTYAFFFIAFYNTSDVYLADNFMEIATVDYFFKVLISGIFFLPLYRILLNRMVKRLKSA